MKENKFEKTLSVIADLIKYKLSLAVVFSSLTGYFIYRNKPDIHFIFLFAGVFLLSSGAASLNQYTERFTDSIMQRTRNRPIPLKTISEVNALRISVLLLLTGCLFLLFNGTIPFIIGLFNVLLYNLFYTRLKRSTILSIIPGALVGALPPMIGFFSAGGIFPDQQIIAFSSFMFLWQLPHFWLIIIKYGKEYRDAGFATISKYLSEIQIRYLTFIWVLFSSGLLFLYFIFSEALSNNLFMLFSVLNIAFIILFYRMLFIKKTLYEIKGAFILINSFSLLIMFLLIAESFINRS